MSSPHVARIGSQRPAYLNLPDERLASVGQEAIELAALAGLQLDDWQQWLLTESLQTQRDGRWSAFEVAAVIPRQNGKGGYLEARQLYGLFLGGEQLAVHTAHEFKTCFEHFLRIVALVENTPELDRRVARIRRGAGEQSIELVTGERLRFLARSAGSGRGMSGDTVYLDEAFALTPPIMGALLPTLSAVPNPQVVYTSSAPTEDQQVLYELVQRGRSGGSPRLLYCEWGNPPDVSPHDRDAWYQANPALGIRITEEFIIAELDAMRAYPAEFLRERLGVVAAAGQSGVIPTDRWRECVDSRSNPASGVAALQIGPQSAWSAMAFAGRRDDGCVHVELVRHERGTAWVVEAAKKAVADTGQPLIIDAKSPTAGVLDRLKAEKVPVLEVTPASLVTACAAFQDDVLNNRIRHLDQAPLNAAVAAADVRPVGEAWVFSAKASTADITPLLAAVLAADGARGSVASKPLVFAF